MGKPTLSLQALLEASSAAPRGRLILAVDPGKKTGLVLAAVPPELRPPWRVATLLQEEREMDEFVDFAYDLFDGETCCRVPDLVLCEDYDIDQRRDQGQHWSLEQRGVLRQLARRGGVEFAVQRPNQVLRLVTDERLEPFGLNKRGGDGHWRDAARHLIYHLAKEKIVELPV